MKQLFATFTLVICLFSAALAQQTVASDFYLMKNSGDADFVLKAINTELKLTGSTYQQVKDLIDRSAASQQELLKSRSDEGFVSSVKARQTAHIENNLRNILGEAQFALYQEKKAAMVAHLAEYRAAKK